MVRMFVQTYGNVRIMSLNRNDGRTLNVNHPGQMEFQLNEGHLTVHVMPNSQIVEITTQGLSQITPFSFDIGYENWEMANVIYEAVPEAEQNVFGKVQFRINNNWRITTGPQEYSTNCPINRVQISANRRALFRFILDRSRQEPHRIDVRLYGFNFAGLFFAVNQLVQIRYNGDYLMNLYQGMQRTAMFNPNEFGLLPFHDPAFMRMFAFLEDHRDLGINERPERIQAFNHAFLIAMQELHPIQVQQRFMAEVEQLNVEERFDVEDLMDLLPNRED